MRESNIMRYPIALLLCTSAWAGQSLVSTSNYVYSSTFPSRAHTVPTRVEFYIHDWPDSPSPANAMIMDSLGLQVSIQNPSILFIYDRYEDLGGAQPQLYLNNVLLVHAAYVRIQRDVVAGQFEVEVWDNQGRRVYVFTHALGTDLPDTIQGFQCGIPGLSTAFLRVHSNIVPLNSRPPVTADNTNTLLHWKFDGDLTDASGNGYDGTISSGTAGFGATPYQNVVANIAMVGAPLYSSWRTMRVGHTNQMDCTKSFSQADASANVTCAWSLLSGPSWSIDNAAAQQPNVTPSAFGDYNIQLQVTDTASTQATTSLHIGAVVMDDNGVVIPTDSRVTTIFGPMMAWGWNPWGKYDERAMYATTRRMAMYQDGSWNNGTPNSAYSLNSLPWNTPHTGTVTYVAAGKSQVNSGGTTLCAAIPDATTLTITLCGVGDIDFSMLPGQPTRLQLGNPWDTYNDEAVRICSIAGNVLTVCSGGRGVAGDPTTNAAKAWPNGTRVSQMKVVGAGTSFLSTVCNVANPDWVLTLHYTRSPALTGSLETSDAQLDWPSMGCESDTVMYAFTAHDIPLIDGVTFTGVRYSHTITGLGGFGKSHGPNWYGQDLEHRVLYYRSGLDSALAAARLVSSTWSTSPYIAGGDPGVTPYETGGQILGAITAATLDPIGSGLTFADVRGFGSLGQEYSDVNTDRGACNGQYDTRDTGYMYSGLALLALFDTNPTAKAAWVSTIATNQWIRTQTCKGADNSWINSAGKVSFAAPALTVTDGSPSVTGTGFTSSLCRGISSGSVVVNNGSSSVSGTGFVPVNSTEAMIAITGTKGGQPFTGWYVYQYNSPTSITLGVLWPGDSGAGTHITNSDNTLTVIGTNLDDVRLNRNWSCTVNSSTSITLNKPWVKVGGGSEQVYTSTAWLGGRVQQPFMLGGMELKALQWNALADTSHDWAGLANAAAIYWASTYDAPTKSTPYAVGNEACGMPPMPIPTASPIFSVRTAGCNYGLSQVPASRIDTGEGASALAAYYAAVRTTGTKSFVDNLYGALFGDPNYTDPSVYAGDSYTGGSGSGLSDDELGGAGSWKWPGFFFGMGMGHQWPAARLSGGAPVTRLPIFGGKVVIGGKVMVN